jgi:organic hydroperoxide reductase OsmC/OhrA
MSEHTATMAWPRETAEFTYEEYNRDHDWTFDGGVTVRASATPDYRGNAQCVDPEEAFVASVASCHMLTFLALAARERYVVDAYRDQAVGILGKDPAGSWEITRVILRPEVRFGGEVTPSDEGLRRLHERAHHGCFIASSVKSEVIVKPR